MFTDLHGFVSNDLVSVNTQHMAEDDIFGRFHRHRYIGGQDNGWQCKKIIIVINLFLSFMNLQYLLVCLCLRFSTMAECQLLQNTRPQMIFQKYFTHIGVSVAELGNFNMKKIV